MEVDLELMIFLPQSPEQLELQVQGGTTAPGFELVFLKKHIFISPREIWCYGIAVSQVDEYLTSQVTAKLDFVRSCQT